MEPEIRKPWEGAAPGWAKWEETVGNWMEPEAMLEMAGVIPGVRFSTLQVVQATRRCVQQGGLAHKGT